MALYGMNSMKLVAILATYNEERFVANCARNLVAQEASIYLIDNESTDATIRRARETDSLWKTVKISDVKTERLNIMSLSQAT